MHLIGCIIKTCQALPSAASIPAEQSVPAAREVIVIFWRRGERWPGSYFHHITRVRKRLTGRVSRGMQRKVEIK